MNNELRILPLRKYEVTYTQWGGMDNQEIVDTFTADFHDRAEVGGMVFARFYRTGNIIREYGTNPSKIVISPVDAADLPA